ncbi:hypothetical protein AOLI_G00270420 [Acnodon oligacanthus]
MDGADHWQGRGGDEEVIRYFMTGAPIIFQFIELLQDQSPKLKEAPDVEKCDFILFFCQSFSETKTAIESALQELPSTEPAKPVLLVVLHYTLDPDINISDSSQYVTRENMFTVDCLVCEENLLQCTKNDEALTKAKEWIEPEIEKQRPEIQHEHPCASTDLTNKPGTAELQEVSTEQDCDVFLHDIDAAVRILSDLPDSSSTQKEERVRRVAVMERFGKVKYSTIVTGETKNAHEDLIRNLHKHRPNLQKVSSLDECDVILVFCPVVSRAGTDIEAALKKLNDKSATKPAVLVVLHHTFDPDSTVPDSSRAVTRENTLTVDCLFHENKGLLQCRKTNTALEKITEHLKLQKPASALTRRDYGTVSSQPSAQSFRQPLLQSSRSNAGEGTESCCSDCCCSVLCCHWFRE